MAEASETGAARGVEAVKAVGVWEKGAGTASEKVGAKGTAAGARGVEAVKAVEVWEKGAGKVLEKAGAAAGAAVGGRSIRRRRSRVIRCTRGCKPTRRRRCSRPGPFRPGEGRLTRTDPVSGEAGAVTGEVGSEVDSAGEDAETGAVDSEVAEGEAGGRRW